MIVLCVFKISPFEIAELMNIFTKFEKAEEYRDKQRAALDTGRNPVYDKYGLVEGIDFIIEPWSTK
jgi:hypothetical protein